MCLTCSLLTKECVCFISIHAVGNVAVLGISTPDDEFNHYTELIDMKDDEGTLIFNVIKIGLSCEECLTKQIECVHRKNKMPHWRPAHRNDKVKKMIGNKLTADRELGGQVAGSAVFTFKRKWLDDFVSRVKWSPSYPINALFLAIDPCGGGRASDWAMCTVGFEDGKTIVSFGCLI